MKYCHIVTLLHVLHLHIQLITIEKIEKGDQSLFDIWSSAIFVIKILHTDKIYGTI